MLILMTTRFNTKTWNERERWIENNSWRGAIYGTPIRVNSKRVGTMVVLEMHNTENKVKAIGLVKTQAWPTDKVHQKRGCRLAPALLGLLALCVPCGRA